MVAIGFVHSQAFTNHPMHAGFEATGTRSPTSGCNVTRGSPGTAVSIRWTARSPDLPAVWLSEFERGMAEFRAAYYRYGQSIATVSSARVRNV